MVKLSVSSDPAPFFRSVLLRKTQHYFAKTIAEPSTVLVEGTCQKVGESNLMIAFASCPIVLGAFTDSGL